ncbi:MAG: hypothetical protein HDS38_04525 [Bacteroides sp.]|nr:hypothetical protein [Bacteroides sp.]
MKQTDKTIKNSSHGEYILIEEVEAHLTESFREIIYRKLRSLFQSCPERIESHEEYEVTIFVASDQSVDEKINEINKRLLKKSISYSQVARTDKK